MTLITWQNGGPVLRGGQIGSAASCCCGAAGGICLYCTQCIDGLTQEQCEAKDFSICIFEIFEAQLGFVPQGQEDCPAGWTFNGVNGCNKGICVENCNECDALSTYPNSLTGCDNLGQVGTWVPGTTCANYFP